VNHVHIAYILFFVHHYAAVNKLAQMVMLRLILEVPGMNLGCNNHYPPGG
jgi:hypothetical protein